MTIAETQPWWAIPAVGVLSAALAAAIAFTATWIATSREIRRRERDTRRTIYARYLAAVNRLVQGIADLADIGRDISDVRAEVRAHLLTPSVTPSPERGDAALERFVVTSEKLLAEAEVVRLALYEVLLCAGRKVSTQVNHLQEALIAYRAAHADGGPDENACVETRKAVEEAIGAFFAAAQAEAR